MWFLVILAKFFILEASLTNFETTKVEEISINNVDNIAGSSIKHLFKIFIRYFSIDEIIPDKIETDSNSDCDSSSDSESNENATVEPKMEHSSIEGPLNLTSVKIELEVKTSVVEDDVQATEQNEKQTSKKEANDVPVTGMENECIHCNQCSCKKPNEVTIEDLENILNSGNQNIFII